VWLLQQLLAVDATRVLDAAVRRSRRGTSSGIVPKLPLSVFADLRFARVAAVYSVHPLRSSVVESNPYILLLVRSQAGHVAFISSNSSPSHRADDIGSSRFAETSSDQSAEDDLRFATQALRIASGRKSSG